MDIISATRLLSAGEKQIQLYADGSFSEELQLGAWAFRVPEFKLDRAEARHGRSSHWFEFAAVVEGLETITALDKSGRSIHVRTDSEFVIATLKQICEGGEMRFRRLLEQALDLYERATALKDGRMLLYSRSGKDQCDHQKCHILALQHLRERIRAAGLNYGLALRREEQRRCALLKRRVEVESCLQKLEVELLMCEQKIQALRQVCSGNQWVPRQD